MDADTMVKFVANVQHALFSRQDAYPETLYWDEQSAWCNEQLDAIVTELGYDPRDKMFERVGPICPHCHQIMHEDSEHHTKCDACMKDCFDRKGDRSWEGAWKAQQSGEPCPQCEGLGLICDQRKPD